MTPFSGIRYGTKTQK